MALQGLGQVVGFCLRTVGKFVSSTFINMAKREVPVVPDLDQIVAATGHEPSLLARAWVGANQATCESSRGPADRVHAHSMSMESLMSPVVVTELKDADMPVGGSTGKKTPALVGSP